MDVMEMSPVNPESDCHFRTRGADRFASAIWRANAMLIASASGPAILRASVSTSSDNTGSEQTGRLSP
jgi:hypothetical protein